MKLDIGGVAVTLFFNPARSIMKSTTFHAFRNKKSFGPLYHTGYYGLREENSTSKEPLNLVFSTSYDFNICDPESNITVVRAFPVKRDDTYLFGFFKKKYVKIVGEDANAACVYISPKVFKQNKVYLGESELKYDVEETKNSSIHKFPNFEFALSATEIKTKVIIYDRSDSRKFLWIGIFSFFVGEYEFSS